MFMSHYDPLEINDHYMHRLFGRCEMLECKVMDLIISYWKDDPEMKHLFETGKRVLLTPNTIPVSYLFAVFQLLNPPIH